MKGLAGRDVSIYLTAALISLLLAFDGSLRATVVNADGICYLQSAATIASSGLHAAMQVCGQAQWPFYSLLIYGLAAVSQFSLIHAAFILNGLFSLITVLTFIYLVSLFDAKQTVLWFAAGAILLLHEFNSVREYIIRDHGFWAFYLISVVLLIKYLRKPTIFVAIAWSAALVIATLFRVEGVIFLLLLPLTALLQPISWQQRLQQFIELNLVTLLVGILALFYAFSHHQPTHDVSRFNELTFQVQHGFQVLVQTYNAKADALAAAILNGYSARDAKLLFGLLLTAWYGVSVITNLSVIFAVLFGFSLSKKLLPLDSASKKVFAGYILINVLITAPFLVEYLFLSKRYLLAMSLLLLVWVPFALAALWEKRQYSRWPVGLAVILIVASALGGIIDFGYSKRYIHDAGFWLANNTPANALIYSNDLQVMYYSGHFGNSVFNKAREFADLSSLSADKWQQYDYLAVHVDARDPKDKLALAQMPLAPSKVFANSRGDSILIYVRPHKEI
jgi:hypothetical protein